MKRLLLGAATFGLLIVAVAFSQPAADRTPLADLHIQTESRNPWTNLRLNNDPTDFRFAIVSDRTGGHRPRVFSRAVEQLNLMQPEFVLSVGDLIEGYKDDPTKLAEEWREFQGYVTRLQMPFFYVAGNHDMANAIQSKQWSEKFGRAYYHFVYRGVLFLLLNSSDPDEKTNKLGLSPDQLAFARKVLGQNADARWTIIVVHKPVWAEGDGEKSGWSELERALEGRKYTVFAGHVHRYHKFVRQGMNYYQLATTGGGSRMRGVRYGEFDHITWVTMKKDGPILANLMLDGIYPDDMRLPGSDEEGVSTANRKPVHPVRGTVHFDGTPLAGGTVSFYPIPLDKKKPTKSGDALIEPDGSFVLSTYTANDGSPVGEFIVTVTGVGVPEKYGKPETSDLRVTVKTGTNVFPLELKK
jgi:3',5'-cyclic AMP phosphodiesterase CpdA